MAESSGHKDIPDELVEAGAQALPGGTNYVMSGDAGLAGTMNRLTASFVIDAVAPMIRAAVAEEIAQAIEARITPMPMAVPHSVIVAYAAEIAREFGGDRDRA